MSEEMRDRKELSIFMQMRRQAEELSSFDPRKQQSIWQFLADQGAELSDHVRERFRLYIVQLEELGWFDKLRSSELVEQRLLGWIRRAIEVLGAKLPKSFAGSQA